MIHAPQWTLSITHGQRHDENEALQVLGMIGLRALKIDAAALEVGNGWFQGLAVDI
jgi:hypothetical protein